MNSYDFISVGAKARLVLCMIVWQRPNLLLLDEPTNHLDPADFASQSKRLKAVNEELEVLEEQWLELSTALEAALT